MDTTRNISVRNTEYLNWFIRGLRRVLARNRDSVQLDDDLSDSSDSLLVGEDENSYLELDHFVLYTACAALNLNVHDLKIHEVKTHSNLRLNRYYKTLGRVNLELAKLVNKAYLSQLSIAGISDVFVSEITEEDIHTAAALNWRAKWYRGEIRVLENSLSDNKIDIIDNQFVALKSFEVKLNSIEVKISLKTSPYLTQLYDWVADLPKWLEKIILKSAPAQALSVGVSQDWDIALPQLSYDLEDMSDNRAAIDFTSAQDVYADPALDFFRCISLQED